MRLTYTLRLISNQRLDVLKNAVKLTVAEAPQYLNKVKEEQKKIMYEKLIGINNWYTKIIGLDEVKLYQDKVTSLQDQLLKTQEKRREIGRQLADIRQKSLQLQDEITKVKRHDDLTRYLDLMKQEAEILRLENSISQTFQDYDQAERELFTAFSNAIRDSHEKQRAQLEYTKYFGIILSITGSLVAFVFTMIKKQDLKKYIEGKLLDKTMAEPIVFNLVQVNQKMLNEVIKNREALNEVVKVLNAQGKVNTMYVNPGGGTAPNVGYVPLPNSNDYSDDLLKVGACVGIVTGVIFFLSIIFSR